MSDFIPTLGFRNPFMIDYSYGGFPTIDYSQYFRTFNEPINFAPTGFKAFEFDTSKMFNFNFNFNFNSKFSNVSYFPKFSSDSLFNFKPNINSNSFYPNTFTMNSSAIKRSNNSHVKAGKSMPKEEIMELVRASSKKYGVDEKLIVAVMRQESGFKSNATSPCGAMGLMQLMPATAKELGVQNAYDPAQNIDGGVKFLKRLLDKYNGDTKLALAAYNGGPGRLKSKGYDISQMPKETRNYVSKVHADYMA